MKNGKDGLGERRKRAANNGHEVGELAGRQAFGF